MMFVLQIYPMAVVGTASRGLVIYQLENTPSEFKVIVVILCVDHVILI